jgi:hypothetical protein
LVGEDRGEVDVERLDRAKDRSVEDIVEDNYKASV